MRRLRRFGFNRIKEGFDQLPTAICFFDSRGSIVLCNRQMYRLSHYLFESDMQYLGEVERALATPPEGILQLSNMEGTYRFPDNTIWQFEKTEVTDRYGETYIQLTAADVTELCHVLGLLFEENKRLAEDEEHLQRLSENVEKISAGSMWKQFCGNGRRILFFGRSNIYQKKRNCLPVQEAVVSLCR